MKRRPVHTKITQNFLTCIRELVDVEADDIDPEADLFSLLLPLGSQALDVIGGGIILRPKIEYRDLTQSVSR